MRFFRKQAAPEPASRRERALREAVSWIKSLALALVLAVIIKAWLVESHVITTGSMIPTIQVGDRVFVNKLAYRFKEPERGHIVTFTPPDYSSADGEALLRNIWGIVPYVKRVAAVEDDLVEVRSGLVYINGEQQPEPYLREPGGCARYRDFPADQGGWVRAGHGLAPVPADQPHIRVPEGMLLVLGDNRCHSHDSHNWGFLPRRLVRGRVFLRFWPPRRLGAVR